MRAVVVVLLLLVAPDAQAGWDSTKIALVRLDDDAKSKRFELLRKALEEILAPRAKEANPYGIAGVVVVDKAAIAQFLGPDCTFKGPQLEWGSTLGADFVLLYCSTGSGPTIQMALYATSEAPRRMHVVLEPRNGSVGKPALKGVAQGIVAFADTLFSP